MKDTGEIVVARVVEVQPQAVLVDVGYKHEAAIPVKEFAGRMPEVGQDIPVIVKPSENPEAPPHVSHRHAREAMAWKTLEQAKADNSTITVKIIRKIEGGYEVMAPVTAAAVASPSAPAPYQPWVMGFMPGSHSGISKEGAESAVGTLIGVSVLELNPKKKNLVVSRKDLLLQEKHKAKTHRLSQLKENHKIRGKISGVTKFGLFVDLGGIDGLIHKKDVSWDSDSKAAAAFKVGQEIEAVILKIDSAAGKVQLGLKQLQPDPLKKFKKGQTLTGQVDRFSPSGASVKLPGGFRGFIHVSEMSLDRIEKPEQVLKAGQEITARIIKIDIARRSVDLSLRQSMQEEQRKVEKKYLNAKPPSFTLGDLMKEDTSPEE